MFTSSYAQSIVFSHLTVDDGLSNNDVNTLIQDKTGFIWFGTEDGLNRYDGYQFKIFRNDPADSNSISDNTIWALLEDSKGYIWAGTKNGILNRFNPLLENFSQLKLSVTNTSNNSITALFEDSKRNIWIGTRTSGVYKLNPVTGNIINWNRTNDSLKTSLSSQSVRTIAEDRSGNIIIGTYHGMNKFNPDLPFTGFDKFFSINNDPNSLSNSQIYNISKSKTDPDIFWIGTPSGLTKFNSSDNSFKRINIPNPDKLQFGAGASTVIEEVTDGEQFLWIDTYSGLIRMNMNNSETTRFVHSENNPHSIADDQINKMIKDRSGVIWLATENGISHFSPAASKFNSFFNKELELYQRAVTGKKNLKAITQNENGDIWFGFENGIVSINNSGNVNQTNNIHLLDNLNVWSLVEENNSLWIGTFGQELKRFHLQTGKIEDWSLIYSLKNTKTVPFIKSLFLDSQNNLWIGYWGSGIGRLNPSSGEYYIWNHIPGNNHSLSSGDVWTIKEDEVGRIWIGTSGGGLNLFLNEDDVTFRRWLQSEDSEQSLSSNNIYSICIAKHLPETNSPETLLWIGTSNGLNKFIIKNNQQSLYSFDKKIKKYSIPDGLNDNNINSIIEDEAGNLWLGTGSGITYFNVSNETFTNFSATDGLIGTMM
ncbi:MAG: two-component regulator propeller domain-containing protein, partial [Ignavibacteriaceae bacterium]